jgi:hypothetical protein
MRSECSDSFSSVIVNNSRSTQTRQRIGTRITEEIKRPAGEEFRSVLTVRLKVLSLIVIPPGEYLVNRVIKSATH